MGLLGFFGCQHGARGRHLPIGSVQRLYGVCTFNPFTWHCRGMFPFSCPLQFWIQQEDSQLWWLWKVTLQISCWGESNWLMAPAASLWVPHWGCAEPTLPVDCSQLMPECRQTQRPISERAETLPTGDPASRSPCQPGQTFLGTVLLYETLPTQSAFLPSLLHRGQTCTAGLKVWLYSLPPSSDLGKAVVLRTDMDRIKSHTE